MTKRLKTVYRNAGEVLHIWAQQNGHDVRCSNAFTRGTALYSYATPIANFVTNKKGKRACLITTVRYSVTTSQNMPSASDIPDNTPVFHVHHIGVTGGRSPYPKNYSVDGYHQENIEIMAQEYNSALDKLSRARSNAEYIINDLNALREKAQSYAKFFSVKFSSRAFPIPNPELIAAIRERNKKQAAKDAAKRAAEKLARERSAADQAAAFLAGDNKALKHDFFTYANSAAIDKVRERIKALWISGEVATIPYQCGIETLLRVKGDDIETSRGATFPTSHGVKAIPIIRAVVNSGTTWHRNGKTIHLGHYQIDSIDPAQGIIKAGCHVVPLAEVERIAATLGV